MHPPQDSDAVSVCVGCCMTISVWQLMVYGTPKWTFPATFILLGTFSFVDAYFFSGCAIFHSLLIFICFCLIYVLFVQFSFVVAYFFCSLLVFSLSILTIIRLVLFSVRRVVSHYVRHASDIWCRYCKLPCVFASLVLVRHLVIIMLWKPLSRNNGVSPRLTF